MTSTLTACQQQLNHAEPKATKAHTDEKVRFLCGRLGAYKPARQAHRQHTSCTRPHVWLCALPEAQSVLSHLRRAVTEALQQEGLVGLVIVGVHEAQRVQCATL